jgi:hypothetical protein
MPNYYAHQHTQSGSSTVVPVGELYAQNGQVVKAGSGGVEHSTSNIKPATYTMLRPHQRRKADYAPGKALCTVEGCKAFPMKTQDVCSGHARSMGLIDNWSTKRKVADGDTDVPS